MLEIPTHRPPILHSITNLFEALHTNDIVYCNLKGNDQHLKNALTGESDIDVLFDVKQKAKLELTLSMLGFKEFVAIRQKRFKDICDFFTLDDESGNVIHLHTYYRVSVGEPFLKGYQLDLAAHILDNRACNEEYGLYCIQPALELILLYLTEALKLRGRDFIRLILKNSLPFEEKAMYQHSWLKARTSPSQLEDTVNKVFPDHPIIVRLVKSEFNKRTLQQLAPHVKRALAKYRSYSPLAGLWLRWYREISLKIRRILVRIFELPVLSMRINPRGGIIIAIMERNEATRAAIIGSLKETFAKKLDVYPVVFRTHGSMPVTSGNNSLGRFMYAAPRAWKIWQKLNWMRSAKKKGALVICDYSPQPHNGFPDNSGPLLADLLISRNRLLKCLARLESQMYSRINYSYSPDLVFEFVPADQLVESSAFEKDAYSGTRMKTVPLKQPRIENNGRLVKVDAAKSRAEKVRILTREIWKDL